MIHKTFPIRLFVYKTCTKLYISNFLLKKKKKKKKKWNFYFNNF